MYRKLAEIAGEYLKKGRPVFIEGRLQTRKWQTKEGQDRYTTEIIAESMQMLGGRDSGGSPSTGGSSASSQPAQGNDEFNRLRRGIRLDGGRTAVLRRQELQERAQAVQGM